MKKNLIYLTIAMLAIAASLTIGTASARDDKEVTIKGEVVDQPCFEKNGGRGDSHKGCALSCAKRGNQLAVVADDSNTVYSITGDYAANKNEKLIPFVAEMVEVKGTVTEKDGKKWLNISSIKKADLK